MHQLQVRGREQTLGVLAIKSAQGYGETAAAAGRPE